uniref:N-lysine methyltransferase SETD6 n=1 Tax=Cavia porcellus TaxID=10141 RepID=H0VZW2_CAVPO
SLRRRRRPSPSQDPDPVSGFLSWCGRVGLELSPKVVVSKQGTVAGYGMVARESVQPGELLFAVPRAALLSPHTCSIGDLLERERSALQSQSGWVPLLLALLHELQAPASPWSPYFALWPELGRLEHPMFCPRVRSLELYHQLVALVMAYSFQEPLEEEEEEKDPNSPLMVPGADILNHLANHNANLEYSADYLRMVATQFIPKGHEIFNTYGQMANWQLIHMYGEEGRLMGLGVRELLTEEELTTTLKVLCMPAEEFRAFQNQDEWGQNKKEEDNLTITSIPKLKASWRRLLRDSVLLTLQTYATDLKTEQDILSNKEAYAKLSWREQQALQVRYGQKMILHQLLALTS